MEEMIVNGANAAAMFCRLNINTKRALPLRSSEIGLLIFVCKSEEPVTPAVAADFFKVSRPMIAGMVKSLAAKGFLTKEPSHTDKRSFTLVPTDTAVELTNSVYDEYFKVMHRLLSGMGKEKYERMIVLLEEANTVLLKGEN